MKRGSARSSTGGTAPARGTAPGKRPRPGDRPGEDTRRAFRTMGWKVFQEVITLGADRTDRATYATITAPTLILGGGASPLAERRVVEKLGAALPNASARFLPAVGHMGPISHAPIVNEAIAAHFRRILSA